MRNNMKISALLSTSGGGFWSCEKRKVRVHKMGLGYVNDDGDFGELRVYFTKRTWNTESHGLIYTDPKFKKQLRRYLDSLGFAGKDVDYSEPGMQGDNYVSLDIGKKFLQSWKKNGRRLIEG
jgi:hypothetical protein